MNVEKLHIDEIRPYWRNPRKNDKAVEVVKESIKRYGYNSPIIVDKKHVIIAGHTRYKALRQLGYSIIPVVILDISEEKAKEYRIADNKSSEKSSWDSDLLMFELREIEELEDMKVFFDNGELDKLLDLTNEMDDFIYDEEVVETKVRAQVLEEDSSSDDEEAFRERMQEEARRLAEIEREKLLARQKELEAENEKFRKKEMEMHSSFTKRSDDRQSDFITIQCPHCEEKLVLSKSELVRKDKILNG